MKVDFLRVNFQWVEDKFNQQLGEDPKLPTFRTELEYMRGQIARAETESERRAIAGQIGGLVKRWQAFIIATLTEAIMARAAEPGRERVRKWQKRVFGKSCASMALERYAKTDRSGGGRGEPIEVPTGLEVQAREIYDRYAPKLKD